MRRQTVVLRNLDAPLKLFGILGMKSCALVLATFAGLYSADFVLNFFTAAFGDLSLIVELFAAGVVGAILVQVERHHDEHHVPAAVRFYLSRPWTVVHGGNHPLARSSRGSRGSEAKAGSGHAYGRNAQ